MKSFEQQQRKLCHLVGRCISDYNLIEDGDRIMVCSSGGKDSYVLLHVLEQLRRRAPVQFDLLAVHLDQGIPGHDSQPLQNWYRECRFNYHIIKENTYGIFSQLVSEGKNFCALCSRLRRGILYNAAQRLKCNKIALGHNRDDTIETLLLNLFYTGSMKAMPAKLLSDDHRNTVIRPLLYAGEEDIRLFSETMGFPVISCPLYDKNEGNRRELLKQWLSDLQSIAPHVKNSIMAAMKNVKVSHLLDRELLKSVSAMKEGSIQLDPKRNRSSE